MSELASKKRVAAPSVGYLELLRSNRGFRFLWFGQVVSQMGDWFDTIAVYTIALTLTGSTRSVALIMVARFLPGVVMGPLSGVVADRFSRRTIMIASDIVRAIVVLGFLFVRRPDQMWLVYVLTVLQLAFSTFRTGQDCGNSFDRFRSRVGSCECDCLSHLVGDADAGRSPGRIRGGVVWN